MTKKCKFPIKRSGAVKGVWYDQYADHWYNYPAKVPADVVQMPSICIRGHWISAAGFPVGRKLEVQISENLIMLRPKEM